MNDKMALICTVSAFFLLAFLPLVTSRVLCDDCTNKPIEGVMQTAAAAPAPTAAELVQESPKGYLQLSLKSVNQNVL